MDMTEGKSVGSKAPSSRQYCSGFVGKQPIIDMIKGKTGNGEALWEGKFIMDCNFFFGFFTFE